MPPSYWKTLVTRALGESWELVVGQPISSVAVAFVIFLVVFRIKRTVSGVEAVRGTVTDALIGLLAVGLLMIVVFLIHALLITPARMFKEKEAERAVLAAQARKDAARFVSRDAKIAFVPVEHEKSGFFIVRVTFANVGSHGAIDTESDLWMVETSLTKPPIFHKRGSSSNEIEGDTYLGVNSEPLTLTKNDPPYFVVVNLSFTDAMTKERHNEVFFYKFGGTNAQGNFLDALWGVSVDEKRRIIRYFDERRLADLHN